MGRLEIVKVAGQSILYMNDAVIDTKSAVTSNSLHAEELIKDGEQIEKIIEQITKISEQVEGDLAVGKGCQQINRRSNSGKSHRPPLHVLMFIYSVNRKLAN